MMWTSSVIAICSANLPREHVARLLKKLDKLSGFLFLMGFIGHESMDANHDNWSSVRCVPAWTIYRD